MTKTKQRTPFTGETLSTSERAGVQKQHQGGEMLAPRKEQARRGTTTTSLLLASPHRAIAPARAEAIVGYAAESGTVGAAASSNALVGLTRPPRRKRSSALTTAGA